FNKNLKTLLSSLSVAPIASNNKFQTTAQKLMKAIIDTINLCVSHTKPYPHSKRW
ncbi:hypothetical protein BDR06DRAFT_878073, partial [Suillus hirtellus]